MQRNQNKLTWLVWGTIAVVFVVFVLFPRLTRPQPNPQNTDITIPQNIPEPDIPNALEPEPFTTVAEEDQWISAVACSNNSRMIAWGKDNGDIVVGRSPKLAVSLWGKDGPSRGAAKINGVSWSPDGKLLASAQADGAVRIWEARTRRIVQTLIPGPANKPVVSVAFAPKHDAQGRLLVACGSAGGYAVVFDAVTGKKIARLDGHAAEVRALAWNPDGRTLVTGSIGARLWNTATWKPRRVEQFGNLDIGALAYSPDGKTLAAGIGHDGSGNGMGGKVLITDGETHLSMPLGQHSDIIHALAWQGNEALFSAGNDHTVYRWEVTTSGGGAALMSMPVWQAQAKGPILSICLGGSQLFAGTSAGVASISLPIEEGESWRTTLRNFVEESKPE